MFFFILWNYKETRFILIAASSSEHPVMELPYWVVIGMFRQQWPKNDLSQTINEIRAISSVWMKTIHL